MSLSVIWFWVVRWWVFDVCVGSMCCEWEFRLGAGKWISHFVDGVCLELLGCGII